MFSRRMTLWIGLLAVVVVFVLAMVVRARSTPGTVTFRSRDYIQPSSASAIQTTRKWGRLVNMHAKSNGMDVFIPASVLHPGFDPTVLMLRRNDGTFIVYGLSGGP